MLATLTVAGCTGTNPGSGGTETEPTRTTHTSTANPKTTPSTTPPNIRDLGVPVEQSDCPFAGEGVARVVCYPEQPSAPLALTPSTDTVALPKGSVTVTLANDVVSTFSVNFYDWGLHKRVDGQWFYVTPQLTPDPLHTVPPGGSHEWTVEVDNSHEPAGESSSRTGGTVAGLGAGEYVFEVSGWFEEYAMSIGLGAQFSLDGAQLELTPSDDLSGERDGDTVVATRSDEDDQTEALVVERVGEAGVPPGKPIYDHIAEQLVRPYFGEDQPWLGDALAFFEEGVSTVRVQRAAEIDPGRFDSDQRYYVRFRGDIYEAEVVSLA